MILQYEGEHILTHIGLPNNFLSAGGRECDEIWHNFRNQRAPPILQAHTDWITGDKVKNPNHFSKFYEIALINLHGVIRYAFKISTFFCESGTGAKESCKKYSSH